MAATADTMKVTKRAKRVVSGAGNCRMYADASAWLACSRASKTCGNSLNSRMVQRACNE